MIENIKNIIDESLSTLNNIRDDYELMSHRLGINSAHGFSLTLIQDEIIRRITDALDRTTAQSNQNISFARLKDVEKGLVYRYLLQDEPNIEYLNVLKTLFAIRDSRIQKIPSFEETETWKLIFSYIKAYQLISPHSFSIYPLNIRNEYPQEFDRAEQIKILKSVGCKVSKIDDDIKIGKIDLAIIKLEKLIKSVGGVSLAKQIFQSLSKIIILHTLKDIT